MKWISLTLLVIFAFSARMVSSSPFIFSTAAANLADSLYSKKLYVEALQKYLELTRNDDFVFNDPKFDFKLAYCYFNNKQYFHAKNILTNSELLKDFLPEYTNYLKFKTILFSKQDVPEVLESGNYFVKTYSDHFFADSVTSYLADFCFEHGLYEKAKSYYSDFYKHNKKSKKRAYIYKQIALCEYNLGNTDIAKDRMIQILKKYPGSKDALELVYFLQEKRWDDEELFFLFVDVYLNHGQIKYLSNKLEAYISSIDKPELKEKARYYLFRVYFNKGEYKSALHGFKNLYENLKNEKLKPRILVYIARCYLRLNDKENSAQTYIQYSKEFPRRRLAAECAWKAAWIYEELNNLEKALQQYKAVQFHWPRNSFRYEAKFREGITLYRLKRHLEAISIFKEIKNSRWNRVHKNRAQYWLALTYEKLDQKDLAKALYIDLGKNIFSDYYSIKAYLKEQDSIDSLFATKEKLTNDANLIADHISSIAYDSEKYSRLFVINELLGKEYVLLEISGKKYKPGDLQGWITQAEIYKKLGDYNNAFKIYDMIDYTYFGEYDVLEKPFILKEKYPFYYDSQIDNFSASHNLEKYFILAIIREESGFNKFAHSWADAYGLMQIIPKTAKELASELNLNYTMPEDLFNEELNLQLGIHYVSKLYKRFNNKKEYILAAYNAGPHRVQRWKNYNNDDTADFLAENIEFSQTRNYVKKVLKNYYIYSLLDQLY